MNAKSNTAEAGTQQRFSFNGFSLRHSHLCGEILRALFFLLSLCFSQAADTAAFVKTYCTDCHGAEKQKGERRYDLLQIPAANAATVLELQEIIDQLTLGEMPPKKSPQPSEDEKSALIATLRAEVARASEQLRSSSNQTTLRRMNRREYRNTVGDLFALDMRGFDPTSKFPTDQIVDQLDNQGAVLQTSGYLLAQYLDAAHQVVEKALGSTERPKEQSWTFNGDFQQQDELNLEHKRQYNYRYLCLYEVMDTENHEGGYAHIHGFEGGVPHDGLYEIKVKAQAMNREHPYDPDIFKRATAEPFRLGVVPGDKNAGRLFHPQTIEPKLAEVFIKDGEPEWYTMTVWLDAGRTPRFIFPNGMASCRHAFTRIVSRYQNHWPSHERGKTNMPESRRIVLKYGQMPHIRIHEVKIRGPIIQEWPTASQRAVLGEKAFAPERTREILESFARRAHRELVSKVEIDHLMALVEKRTTAGHSAKEALKDAMKAVLCSPQFLYLQKTESKEVRLSAHATASRLSYFLWSSMPDEELSRAADSGELLKPEILLAQTRRMLRSEKVHAFIEGFTDFWLNLRSLGDTPPDREAFERYYTGDLQAAMKNETQLFTRHLLDENQSIMRFLDADYTFVNQPLANLYGLGDIAKPEQAHLFHRVRLTNRNRGGLLGQASVLTVSANGVETSPVTRGVWLLKNILGTPPPPPPDNIPTIDPDVRGASSIRDILSKHRLDAACNDCHQKIDPLGFALENFDPIGTWRTHYTVDRKRGVVVDASGELPRGQAFRDVGELKQVLVTRQMQFMHTLLSKLFPYACGRSMEAKDAAEVDRVLQAQVTKDGGFRDLVESVISSSIFLHR